MEIELAPGIDTDKLGTFTGEISRIGTMREVAIAKARLGIGATGIPIGIASEGSYGPHPSIPFISCGIELMLLVDTERDIIVTEQLVDLAPIYDHIITADIAGLTEFLKRIHFPDHAVIARSNIPKHATTLIHKGLRTSEALATAIADCFASSSDRRALVQTDMRAHMNSTRMAVLGRLAVMLTDRLATLCPACGSPGYGQIHVETGLPCEWCGSPTAMVRHQNFGCVVCDHLEKRPRSDGLTRADPGHCLECNP